MSESESPTHTQAQFTLNTSDEGALIETPDPDEIDFQSQQEKHLYAVMQDHQGADQAITAADLAEKLHIEDTQGSPRTRKLLTNLIERGVPLVASTGGNAGYYIAETAEEGMDYIDTLGSRIEGIKQRRENAIQNFLMNMEPQE